MSRLLISFSGGETSAFMTKWILDNWRARYDEIVVVFANTGQENEQTLEFVKRCDEEFGFRTVWVEAEIQHGLRRGAKAKVVSFDTASRDGKPFEEMIKKYGIPNQSFKHCTRVLKLDVIYDYTRSIGWAKNTFDVAIGIRADELDRMSSTATANRIIYPLISAYPATKPNINTWWAQQSFRLQLKGYQGNCKWCWKKSLRKHLTLIAETPEIYEFPAEMERKYSYVGPEFSNGKQLPIKYRRTFFRGNRSVEDLFAEYEAKKHSFVPADDEAAVFDSDFDVGAGCEESCEVFSEEDMQHEAA